MLLGLRHAFCERVRDHDLRCRSRVLSPCGRFRVENGTRAQNPLHKIHFTKSKPQNNVTKPASHKQLPGVRFTTADKGRLTRTGFRHHQHTVPGDTPSKHAVQASFGFGVETSKIVLGIRLSGRAAACQPTVFAPMMRLQSRSFGSKTKLSRLWYRDSSGVRPAFCRRQKFQPGSRGHCVPRTGVVWCRSDCRAGASQTLRHCRSKHRISPIVALVQNLSQNSCAAP